MNIKNYQKKIYRMLISGVILSIAANIGCRGNDSSTNGGIRYVAVSQSDTYSGTNEVFKVATSGNAEITHNLDVGSTPKTVYYIFTNTNLTADKTSPSFVANFMDQVDDGDFSLDRPSFSESSTSDISNSLQRGKPEITEFNNNPWKYAGAEKTEDTGRNSSMSINISPPMKSAVNDSISFMNGSTSDLIPSHCRAVVTVGTKTLNIWVADDCWSAWVAGPVKANYITQTMVDAMAAKFLTAGANNDVYDWVTNIYGAEWGTHGYPNLIAADNNIHILLYDIDGDNSTTGGVLGFFWSKDNFKSTGTNSVSYSNEKIMFYMDAVMYATPSGGWDIADPMPAEIISTLAHEFQHMISFYQKNVFNGITSTDSWINEMCSMVTEDLLADKLQVNGPRGVAYGTAGAGTSGNTNGRLPRFNYWNDVSLPVWLTGSNVYNSYSISYAFGAYLARNYGGATLFQDIVKGVSGQSVYGDYRDVVQAVKAHGGAADITMGDLMRDWGAAVVLSDHTSISSPGKFQYNTGASTSSTINSVAYNLGSINLFNYSFGLWNEPKWYSTTDLNNYSSATMNKGSNIYVKESSVTGMRTKTFRMLDGVKLTVVVK